jgi:hypothetical protein
MSDLGNTATGRGEPDEWVRLSAHPRATRSIARSKALGGLVGFVLGFWLASRAGLPAWDTGLRALVGGIAGYVLVWGAAVQVWRQIAMAEYRAAAARHAAYVRDHNDRMRKLNEEKLEALKASREALS